MDSIQSLYSAQKEHFDSNPYPSVKSRKRKLKEIKKWLIANRNSVHTALRADLDKPELETDITELSPVMEEVKLALRYLSDWTAYTKVRGSLKYITTSPGYLYEPLGLNLILSPWNYPFMLALGPLVSCIAAGNPAIVKPSELSPATSRLIKEMVEELFEPNEVVVVQGGVSVSSQLLKLKFNHIFFTGSPRVGKIVMAAAAVHLTKVTLELGGCNPAIIDASVNVKRMAHRIVWGKYLNAGQSCVAPNNLIVHSDIYEKFVEAIKSAIKEKFEDTDGRLRGEDYSRMITDQANSRMAEMKSQATQEGIATWEGPTIDEEGKCSPCLLLDVPFSSHLFHDEVFGPVLPITRYKDDEEIIKGLRSIEKPLVLHVFSSKRKAIKKWIKEIPAGSVCVNDTIVAFSHPSLGFGGSNNSGLGKAHGEDGFKAFSNKKTVVKQWSLFGTSQVVHPPYTSLKKKLAYILFRWM